jgi:hypothetical protein
VIFLFTVVLMKLICKCICRLFQMASPQLLNFMQTVVKFVESWLQTSTKLRSNTSKLFGTHFFVSFVFQNFPLLNLSHWK